MPKHSAKAIHHLSKKLAVETHFLSGCLEAAIVEIYQTTSGIELHNGSALRLRRLQRICLTFDVDLPVALMLTESRVIRQKAGQ